VEFPGMGKLVSLDAGNVTILVESTAVEGEKVVIQSGAVGLAKKNLDKMLEVIKPFCESLKKNFEALGAYKPDSASAEFGLSFSGEGNVFFVKASGEASVKVILNWNKV
jgi:hypothetical protein